jgi:NAD(P)-dependent dehydrogenase (short-subunit alcohol dehydrogenase family)
MMHSEIVELFSLRGKLALITGGARHLGFDAASILAAAGANVIVTSRNADHAEQSAKQLTERFGVGARGFPLDQTNFEQVAGLAEMAGPVDVLVNNAGGGSGDSVARLFERDPREIDRLIQTNLTGMIYCCREFGKRMAERRSGKIINVASIAGLIGRDRRMYERSGMKGQPVDYAAAKAGVIGLTRDLAAYMAPMGVCVNAISPGGFARNLPETFVRDYSDRTPLGRMGRDGIDLKGALLFLATPASDYITGHNLIVDGGFSAWQ